MFGLLLIILVLVSVFVKWPVHVYLLPTEQCTSAIKLLACGSCSDTLLAVFSGPRCFQSWCRHDNSRVCFCASCCLYWKKRVKAQWQRWVCRVGDIVMFKKKNTQPGAFVPLNLCSWLFMCHHVSQFTCLSDAMTCLWQSVISDCVKRYLICLYFDKKWKTAVMSLSLERKTMWSTTSTK